MLLRALAATSAEGWEEEDEKLRSQVDRIKNVAGDDDGPLKQPALPSTFGSFLGARGNSSVPSYDRHTEDAKDRGKEEREEGGTRWRSTQKGRFGKNLVPCSLFQLNFTPCPDESETQKPDSAEETQEKLPPAKKTALSDSLAAAKGRFLPPSSPSSSLPSPSSSSWALLSLAALPVSCAARAGDALLPRAVSGAAARLLDGVVDAAASVVLSSPPPPAASKEAAAAEAERESDGGGGGKQQGERALPPSSLSFSGRPASSSRLGRLAAAAGLAPERGASGASASSSAGEEAGIGGAGEAVVVVEAQLLSSPFPERLALPASTPVAEALDRVVEALLLTISSSSSSSPSSSGSGGGARGRSRKLTFMVVEDRPRVGGGGGVVSGGGGGNPNLPAAGLARTARAAAKRFAAPAAVTDPQRSSSGSGTAGAQMRGALLAWAHFLLLPEPVNRELRGQGYLSWARGSAAWRAVASGVQGSEEAEGKEEPAPASASSSYASSLLRLAKKPFSVLRCSYQQQQPAPRRKRIIRADAPTLPPPPRGSTPVRVELRDGSALSVVARPGSTLGGLSASIEKDLGILEEAQRFLVVEEPEPGLVAKVAGTAALTALKFSAGLAASTARRAAAVAGTAAAVVGVKGGGGGGEEGEDGERGGGGASGGGASGPFSIVVRRRKQSSSSSRQQQERPPLEFEVAPEATMAQVRAAVDAALLAEAEEEEEEEEGERGSGSESSGSGSSGDENDRPAAAATSISLVFPGRGRRRRVASAAAPKQQQSAGGGRRKAFASEIVRIEAAV